MQFAGQGEGAEARFRGPWGRRARPGRTAPQGPWRGGEKTETAQLIIYGFRQLRASHKSSGSLRELRGHPRTSKASESPGNFTKTSENLRQKSLKHLRHDKTSENLRQNPRRKVTANLRRQRRRQQRQRKIEVIRDPLEASGDLRGPPKASENHRVSSNKTRKPAKISDQSHLRIINEHQYSKKRRRRRR